MKKGFIPAKPSSPPGKKVSQGRTTVKASPQFTRELAREIVKNLFAFGRLTAFPFRKKEEVQIEKKETPLPKGEHPVLMDTSVLIDGRIITIVNSGFFVGTLLIPQYILGEIQHIADAQDPIRRMKGRRGLDVVNKLKGQKVNLSVTTMLVSDDDPTIKEVDQKLVMLSKRWKIPLMTVDFNLAQVARANGVKVLNINDLGQALKVPLIPGEEVTVKITHEGKERMQGVGYLSDGTMVVVEDTKDKIGQDIIVSITKVHQTPAGQLFFARLK